MSRALPLCLHPNGMRKRSFRSKAKARQSAINSRKALSVYRCDRCGLWHVTSQPDSTAVELKGGAIVVIAKPVDEVERDIETARADDYTHIRWNSYRKTVPLHRIRGVVRDEETAA